MTSRKFLTYSLAFLIPSLGGLGSPMTDGLIPNGFRVAAACAALGCAGLSALMTEPPKHGDLKDGS